MLQNILTINGINASKDYILGISYIINQKLISKVKEEYKSFLLGMNCLYEVILVFTAAV